MVIRVSGRDLEAFDASCRELEPVAGRRVERSEIVRELMAKFVRDRDIQREIGVELRGTGMSRGGDVGLGL